MLNAIFLDVASLYPEDLDLSALKDGDKGRLVAVVTETRRSTHAGDWSRGIYPETPEVGEEILLGEGKLFFDFFDTVELGRIPTVGLRPEQDPHDSWLDVRMLYRAHEQTVELYFEEI